MLNLFKGKKGFTLVELMIVIAIIGVLAVVLIPQASKMRANAKLAGVESNMRIVQSQCEAIIGDYAEEADFVLALESRLGDMVRNPILTSITTVASAADTGDALTALTANYGVIVVYDSTTILTEANADDFFSAPSGTINAKDYAKGAVIVALYPDANTGFEVKIYGYDANGNPITTAIKGIDVLH